MNTPTHTAANDAKLSPENRALGFASDEQAERHAMWLWRTGTPEFRAWLRKTSPDRAEQLEVKSA